MTEPFTPEELEAARAESFKPYGSEAAWINVRRHTRDVVDKAPPLSERQKDQLRVLLAPVAITVEQPKKQRRR